MDESISSGSVVVGCKKFLVFYTGKAPSGIKTGWVMDEYSLLESTTRTCKKRGSSGTVGFSLSIDLLLSSFLLRLSNSGERSQVSGDWVLCRIQERGIESGIRCDDEDGRELSYLDEIFLSMDSSDEISSSHK